MKKPNLAKMAKTAKKFVSRRSPEILMGIGITGMITTTVLAVKATPKALMLIEDAKFEQEKTKLTPIETVKVAWKPYIPTVVTGVASVACLIGSSSVSARRNAALATAYSLSQTALTEYKEKVVETIGEKKEQVIKDQIAKDKMEKHPTNNTEIFVTSSGDTLFLDTLSHRLFTSDIEKVRKIVNDLNYRMVSGREEYISLNEFYGELGLATTKLGDDLGWNLGRDGQIDISFSAQVADNGKPCLVLDYDVAPRYDYSKLM